MYRTSSLTSKIALFSAVGAVAAMFSIAQATPVITAVSGAVSQGGVLTISGSGFGTKSPAKPYLWAPMDTTLSPSSLGVITAWQTTGFLNYQAGCGPAPGTGCAAGTPSDGVNRNNWTASIYSPSYYSSSGADWNSYGQHTYVYRKSRKTFSYANDPTKNVKMIRMWGTSPSQYITYPDFYFAPSNGMIGVEEVPQNGSSDYNMPAATMTIAQGPVNKWYSEEFSIKSNTSPTSADGDFRLDINGGPDLVTFPNTQWELNTMTLKTASGYGGDGTMKVLYPIHLVIESGGNWVPEPAGAQYFASDVYVDTTWARVMIGNSPVFNQTSDREIQVPFTWSDGSIQVYGNINSFPSGQPMYLFVVDANGNASSGYPLNGALPDPPTLKSIQ